MDFILYPLVFCLERSRQSARECRARKKLRYQYLEDLANTREKAVVALYQELEQVTMLLYCGGTPACQYKWIC